MQALSRLFTLLRSFALAALLAGLAGNALAAKTYSDNLDGTVTDPTTGLQWMRCAIGQTWSGPGATCTGTAATYTWDQAVALTNTQTFAGQSDWRLPNIRELQPIVELSRSSPAIDVVAFPNPSTSSSWSASTNAGNSGYAWLVVFNDGHADGYGSKNGTNHQVRLVRSGQPLGLLDIARPGTDYVDWGNSTVAHTPPN